MKAASLHMEKTTSLLQKIIRKIKRFIKTSTPVVDEPPCFYNLSPTCQVPRLEVIYERYFGRRIDGCFVEVGAYDGDYASNTSGLLRLVGLDIILNQYQRTIIDARYDIHQIRTLL